MEEADWDLLAVVRGFTSTVTAAAAPEVVEHQAPPPADHGGAISPPGFEGLQDFCNPFFSEDLKCPISGISSNPQQQILYQREHQEKKEAQVIFGNRASSTAAGSVFTVTSEFSQRNNLLSAPTTSCSTASQTQQRSKKRKNLQKRVCHVPVEGLSSDMWAWRKYGQKPIKGSPYPRGYYRCSSSKGCPARKQVERNKSDPKMFIVTYTSEHNHPMPTHRNALAGSSRLKPAAAVQNAEKGEIKAECDQEEMGKENIESGDELEFKEMVMNDDFFVGFEDLNEDSDCGDLFSDQIQGNTEMDC
ncbi:hypothetical protein V2J09_013968 [Rumex salicifolius]